MFLPDKVRTCFKTGKAYPIIAVNSQFIVDAYATPLSGRISGAKIQT